MHHLLTTFNFPQSTKILIPGKKKKRVKDIIKLQENIEPSGGD
ncbi:MAG: hypothetical protein CM15mV24_0750 [Bellamyvirus sp.]|nr:MAG: hypothetical protein CM15mV24_0750 [Bellamyvirus sp.]